MRLLSGLRVDIVPSLARLRRCRSRVDMLQRTILQLAVVRNTTLIIIKKSHNFYRFFTQESKIFCAFLLGNGTVTTSFFALLGYKTGHILARKWAILPLALFNYLLPI